EKMKLEWKRLGSGGSPDARWGHTCVALPLGQFLVFGGNGNKTFNDLTLYNSNNNSWNKVEPQGTPPTARYGHSATLLGQQQIIIFGGRANSKPFSDVTVLQHSGADRFKWIKMQHQHKSPEGRAGHTAVAHGNQLVVFGGHNSSRSKYYNTVLTFNIDTLTWDQPTCDGIVPPARGSHSSFVVGNQMYIFGGFDGKKYYNDLYSLDLDKLVWRKLECKGNTPKPRSGHSSTLMGDKLVIFGGCGSDSNFLNDVHALSLDDLRWEQPVITGMENPHPRFRHTANSMGQNKVFIYGGTGSGILLSDALILEASDDAPLMAIPPVQAATAAPSTSSAATTVVAAAAVPNNGATMSSTTTQTIATPITTTMVPTSTTTTTTNNNGGAVAPVSSSTAQQPSPQIVAVNTTTTTTTTAATSTIITTTSSSSSPSPSPLSSSPINNTIQITSDSFQSPTPSPERLQQSQPQAQSQMQTTPPTTSMVIDMSKLEKEKKSKKTSTGSAAFNTLKMGSEKILGLFEKDNEIKVLRDSLAVETSNKLLADLRIEKELGAKKKMEDQLSSEKIKFENKRLHLESLVKAEQKQKQQLEERVAKLNLSNAQLQDQVGKLTAQFKEMESTLLKREKEVSKQHDLNTLRKQYHQLVGDSEVDDLELEDSYVPPDQHRAKCEEYEQKVEQSTKKLESVELRYQQLSGNRLEGLDIEALSNLEEVHQRGIQKLSAIKQEEWKKQLNILKKEKELLQDQNNCIICTERPPNTVLMPCRHSSLCSKCSNVLTRCPVCRTNIEERIETFN
ncbi:hypothetical protein SAMD00019534_119400, partial [Acytostelium subglobosum LB1]|uniref:hypothetical protein n=1 Tax=Acytostelium subglobosum LB1 TaxID=1410327 RepID=UPI000644D006